jgi:hypothetical protein
MTLLDIDVTPLLPSGGQVNQRSCRFRMTCPRIHPYPGSFRSPTEGGDSQSAGSIVFAAPNQLLILANMGWSATEVGVAAFR